MVGVGGTPGRRMVDSARRHRHRQLSRHQRQIAGHLDQQDRPTPLTGRARETPAANMTGARGMRARRTLTACSCQAPWPAAARRAGVTADSRRRPRRRPGPTARPRPRGGSLRRRTGVFARSGRRAHDGDRGAAGLTSGLGARRLGGGAPWARGASAAFAAAGPGSAVLRAGAVGGSRGFSRAPAREPRARRSSPRCRRGWGCSAPCRETRGNRRRHFRRRRCGGSTRHD